MSIMPKTSARYSIANIASKTEHIPAKVLRFMLQSAARELLPNERVADCLRKPVPGAARIEIHKSKSTGAAHYRNLVVCARIWHCPVCAARISEERRLELSKAVNSWTGGLALVTYTASHSNRSTLPNVLSPILSAYRRFKSGRVFEELTDFYGWNGSVKSLEVTYGKNGWHPHIHELVFLTNEMDQKRIGFFEHQVKMRWIDCLKKEKQFASVERGVTVKNGDNDVADYVGKFGETKVRKEWTVAHEVAKSLVKKAKLDGRSPLQLLYDYMLGDQNAGKLWIEYALVFKGKHQLVWSRGMRQLLNLSEEKSDEVLAETYEQDSALLAEITLGRWYAILEANAQGEVLNNAEHMEAMEFRQWLNDFTDQILSG